MSWHPWPNLNDSTSRPHPEPTSRLRMWPAEGPSWHPPYTWTLWRYDRLNSGISRHIAGVLIHPIQNRFLWQRLKGWQTWVCQQPCERNLCRTIHSSYFSQSLCVAEHFYCFWGLWHEEVQILSVENIPIKANLRHNRSRQAPHDKIIRPWDYEFLFSMDKNLWILNCQ